MNQGIAQMISSLDDAKLNTDKWLARLRENTPTLRCVAAVILAHGMEHLPDEVLAQIVERVSVDEEERWNAVSACFPCEHEPLSNSALPALVEAMTDQEPVTRRAIMRIVYDRYDPIPAQALPMVLKALYDDDAFVRDGAKAILKFGYERFANEFTFDLLHAATVPPEPARARSLSVPGPPLNNHGDAHPLNVKVFNDLLFVTNFAPDGNEEVDDSIRPALLWKLSETDGPLPDNAIPVLLGALNDENHMVRRAAMWLLRWRFDRLPSEALPAFVDALCDPDNWVVTFAALALHKYFNPLPESALPSLLDAFDVEDVELLDDEGPEIRLAALWTIAENFKSLPLDALEPLSEALNDNDERIRRGAIHAIGQHFQSLTETVIPLLNKSLHDIDESNRAFAALSLFQHGQSENGVIDALLRAAKLEADEIRQDCIRAVEKYHGDKESEAARFAFLILNNGFSPKAAVDLQWLSPALTLPAIQRTVDDLAQRYDGWKTVFSDYKDTRFAIESEFLFLGRKYPTWKTALPTAANLRDVVASLLPRAADQLTSRCKHQFRTKLQIGSVGRVNGKYRRSYAMSGHLDLDKRVNAEDGLRIAMRHEIKDEIRRIMQQELEPDYAEIIYSIYYQYLTKSEAADALELPRGVFRGRYERAHARLRELLSPHFGET